ncbi:MAG: hypothetical protein FD126_262 [Elusimicrobia bacterium]|nr:MAG: hypothetical protein FD126_262 [Elusimicrobiota bacterium]
MTPSLPSSTSNTVPAKFPPAPQPRETEPEATETTVSPVGGTAEE